MSLQFKRGCNMDTRLNCRCNRHLLAKETCIFITSDSLFQIICGTTWIKRINCIPVRRSSVFK